MEQASELNGDTIHRLLHVRAPSLAPRIELPAKYKRSWRLRKASARRSLEASSKTRRTSRRKADAARRDTARASRILEAGKISPKDKTKPAADRKGQNG